MLESMEYARPRPSGVHCRARGLRGTGRFRLDGQSDMAHIEMMGWRCSSIDTNATDFPSGEGTGWNAYTFASCLGFPPSTDIIHADWIPLSLDRKMTCLPSGVRLNRLEIEVPTSTAPRPSPSAR